MKGIPKDNVGEALVGLLVVLLAIWFLSFAWARTGGGARAGAIEIKALFPNSGGITVGSDVRVAGLKIGTVTGQALDPASYQVAMTLAIDPNVKLPADSSAAITSEGLLGESYVQLLPGGDPTALKAGDTIADTQGAIDMMGLIGQFINRSGGSTPAAAASEGGTDQDNGTP